jgi:helix-turn-helix protein
MEAKPASESAREHSTTEFLTFPLVAPKPRPANPILPVIAVHSSCPWSAETDHRAFFCLAMKSKHPPRRLAIQEARAWAAAVRVGDPHAKSVLLALTYYVNDEFACYVSIDLLASDTEVHPDTVRRRLVLLEQIGAIARTPQWVENGQRNAERRGKRTTDLIKLQVDVDPSSIKPRLISSNGTIVIASSTGHSDEEANSDFSPGTPPGPRHDPEHRSALAQPLHYSKDLISEHEHEDSPPSPSGGVVRG